MPFSFARSVIVGTNTATTGVLLTIPAIGSVVPIVAASARVSLPRVNPARWRPSRWTTPVFWTPALSMYIATMVTVAALANPEIASRGPTPVHGSSTASETMMPIAVTSFGTSSETKNNSAIPIGENTTSAPIGAPATVIPPQLEAVT